MFSEKNTLEIRHHTTFLWDPPRSSLCRCWRPTCPPSRWTWGQTSGRGPSGDRSQGGSSRRLSGACYTPPRCSWPPRRLCWIWREIKLQHKSSFINLVLTLQKDNPCPPPSPFSNDAAEVRPFCEMKYDRKMKIHREEKLPGRIWKWHPLPGSDLPHSQFGSHLLVARVLVF